MEKEPVMTASDVGYDCIHTWLKQILGPVHATVCRTMAWALLCLLLAQRATPAALARAMPTEHPGSGRACLWRGAVLLLCVPRGAPPAALARAMPTEHAGSGRACLRRVRRWWTGPPLDQAVVSPQLIQAALALLPSDQLVVVALDTTRLGPWEVWLAGIVVAGRTMPIGWAVIPYPWPKGQFPPPTIALFPRLPAAFSPKVRWTLVADRGFPSALLFAQLRQGGTGFSVRLRLSDWVTVAGIYAMVAVHLAAGRLGKGQRTAAALGRGRPEQPLVPGWVVVSAAVAAPPRHKHNPG